jgi:hypothetical protein
MIDDHRKDIGDFRDEARENHGQVSDLARSQLPTLRGHLRTAMELQRNDPRDSGADMPRDRGDRAYDNGRYQDNNANRDYDAQNNSRSYDNQRYDSQRNRGDSPDR